MANELKGRYATYYTGDKDAGTVEKQVRLSLNAVRTNFGADIARLVLTEKQFTLGNTHWLELVLLPGEKTAEETRQEHLKRELVKALYLDLRGSYPTLTLRWLTAEADKQLAGAMPTGGVAIWLYQYLAKAGLLSEIRQS